MTHICIFLGYAVQCHFNTFQYLTLTTLWCCFVKSHTFRNLMSNINFAGKPQVTETGNVVKMASLVNQTLQINTDMLLQLEIYFQNLQR